MGTWEKGKKTRKITVFNEKERITKRKTQKFHI